MDGLNRYHRFEMIQLLFQTEQTQDRNGKPGLVLFHLCRKPQIASATENPVTIPVTIYSGGMPA